MYALLASVVSSIAAAATKYVSGYISIGMIVFVQYALCSVSLIPWLSSNGMSSIKTHHPLKHLLRGCAGWACFYTYYLAIANIPLVDASLLRNAAPICVPFLGFILYRNSLSLNKAIATTIGFIGIILILKPTGHTISLWHGIGFLSGVTLALSMLFTRDLSSTEPPNRILFYYFLTSAILSVPIAILNYTPIPLAVWPALLFVSGSIFILMKLYTLAYAAAPTNTVAPYSYFGVVFAGLIGWLVWDHTPDWLALLGITLVVSSGIATLLAKEPKPLVDEH